MGFGEGLLLKSGAEIWGNVIFGIVEIWLKGISEIVNEDVSKLLDVTEVLLR